MPTQTLTQTCCYSLCHCTDTGIGTCAYSPGRRHILTARGHARHRIPSLVLVHTLHNKRPYCQQTKIHYVHNTHRPSSPSVRLTPYCPLCAKVRMDESLNQRQTDCVAVRAFPEPLRVAVCVAWPHHSLCCLCQSSLGLSLTQTLSDCERRPDMWPSSCGLSHRTELVRPQASSSSKRPS